ncbi:glycosyltransferase family 2 protein [Rahnella inusitata]|uniref:glycosyltransferase family 2 protein n=1 Tax=Rahnella inusitata TaxID=58169 RepID=UPI0039BE2D63
MFHVDIAMATYNGEAYIEEQISSIISQTHTSWTLYISDDASNDRTVAIIKQFAELDSRIKLINTARQGGVVCNFNRALRATKSDYVLLADQDDYWHSDRINSLLSFILEKEQKNKPAMVFSDLEVVDDKLITIDDSFYKSNLIDPLDNLVPENLLWKCTVYGCTTIFNRKLLDKCLPIPADVTMHDNWLALNAAAVGGLVYFDHQTIRYRQHNNNVVGGANKGMYKRLLSVKRNIKNLLSYRQKINVLLSEAKKKEENTMLSKININGGGSAVFAFKKILPAMLFKSRKSYSFFMFIIFMVRQ